MTEITYTLTRDDSWYSPKLAETAANIEIKINSLSDSDRDQDRRADLWKAFDALCDADNALANAEFHP